MVGPLVSNLIKWRRLGIDSYCIIMRVVVCNTLGDQNVRLGRLGSLGREQCDLFFLNTVPPSAPWIKVVVFVCRSTS
jgi:hypothetical protein